MYLWLTEAECSIPVVTEKVQEQLGSEESITVNGNTMKPTVFIAHNDLWKTKYHTLGRTDFRGSFLKLDNMKNEKRYVSLISVLFLNTVKPRKGTKSAWGYSHYSLKSAVNIKKVNIV